MQGAIPLPVPSSSIRLNLPQFLNALCSARSRQVCPTSSPKPELTSPWSSTLTRSQTLPWPLPHTVQYRGFIAWLRERNSQRVSFRPSLLITFTRDQYSSLFAVTFRPAIPESCSSEGAEGGPEMSTNWLRSMPALTGDGKMSFPFLPYLSLACHTDSGSIPKQSRASLTLSLLFRGQTSRFYAGLKAISLQNYNTAYLTLALSLFSTSYLTSRESTPLQNFLTENYTGCLLTSSSANYLADSPLLSTKKGYFIRLIYDWYTIFQFRAYSISRSIDLRLSLSTRLRELIFYRSIYRAISLRLASALAKGSHSDYYSSFSRSILSPWFFLSLMGKQSSSSSSYFRKMSVKCFFLTLVLEVFQNCLFELTYSCSLSFESLRVFLLDLRNLFLESDLTDYTYTKFQPYLGPSSHFEKQSEELLESYLCLLLQAYLNSGFDFRCYVLTFAAGDSSSGPESCSSKNCLAYLIRFRAQSSTFKGLLSSFSSFSPSNSSELMTLSCLSLRSRCFTSSILLHFQAKVLSCFISLSQATLLGALSGFQAREAGQVSTLQVCALQVWSRAQVRSLFDCSACPLAESELIRQQFGMKEGLSLSVKGALKALILFTVQQGEGWYLV